MEREAFSTPPPRKKGGSKRRKRGRQQKSRQRSRRWHLTRVHREPCESYITSRLHSIVAPREPRPRTRSSRRVTAVSNRVGANQQRSRSTGASFRWQAKCDRCLDLVINSRSQALVPLIPAPIQRKSQPALVSTLGETSSIITLAHIHRSPGDRLGKNSQSNKILEICTIFLIEKIFWVVK